jgi:glutamine amidotransferase
VSGPVALIDYGAGNLASVRKALAAAHADVVTPGSPADLDRCVAVIVPGVGHFGATQALTGAWRLAIRARVDAGRPFLGICLGLQWMFEGSEEAPGVPGLGLMRGTCFLLGAQSADVPPVVRLKVPHVGWNALALRGRSRLLAGLEPGAQAYFTHSYAAPVTEDCVAVTDHGVPFASVVERDNVFGAQFHPEKSGDVGLRVVANFIALARG